MLEISIRIKRRSGGEGCVWPHGVVIYSETVFSSFEIYSNECSELNIVLFRFPM